MKNLLCFVFLIVSFTTGTLAQHAETIKIDSVLYVTSADIGYMINKETKFLLKANSKTSAEYQSSLALETKMGKSFSASAIIGFKDAVIYENENESKMQNETFGTIELRHYIGMTKRIADRVQANNLSGNYLSTSVTLGKTTGEKWIIEYNPLTYGLAFGKQQRFLNYGYYDLAIAFSAYGFNYSRPEPIATNNKFNKFSIYSDMTVGIAFGKKYPIGEDVKCPIFKCFTNRKSAFKINYLSKFFHFELTHPLKGNSTTFFSTLQLNPNILYEIKIGNSPISFEQDLSVKVTFSFGRTSQVRYAYNYRAGLKYYHLQKSHIRKGRSGNNLSGGYFFGRGQFRQSEIATSISFTENGIVEFGKNIQNALSIQSGYGYQTTVLNNLFYDFSVGFSYDIKRNYVSDSSHFGFVMDYRVGLLF